LLQNVKSIGYHINLVDLCCPLKSPSTVYSPNPT
jgi:hypothetical protein